MLTNLIGGSLEVFLATGAYGRKSNLKDWQEGKDFRILGTQTYFSIRDVQRLKDDGYTSIQFTDVQDFWIDI